MNVAIPMVDVPVAKSRGLGSLRVAGADQAALPLSSVQLRAKVADRVAEVEVEQRYSNPFTDVIEAVYIFPLAGGCAVSRFEMQIGKRIVKGKVEERAEARRQYAQALEQGKRAALLEQERDDVFTMQVGNIAPGDDITVRLTYSERLPFFEDGRTELRLPLVVAPRYVGGEELPREQAGHGVVPDSGSVPDASRITPPRLVEGFDPKLELGIEVELFGGFSELESSQHAVRSASGPERARVQLSREREPLDRDFVLRWKLAGEKVKSALLVHGGYAMLSLLPPAREGYLGTPRDVVFVVDRSGSMQGPKMASAARACALLLRTLGPRDRFAVQAFDDVVEWMPGAFTPADEGGIERGEKWLRGVFSRGGTELDNALRESLEQIRKLGPQEGRVPVVVLLTDGQVGDESGVLKRLQAELGDARVFTVGIDTAVNGGFLQRLAAMGGGTSALVEPGARLEEALQAVGREIGSPLITGLRIAGKVSDAAPASLPDLFAGRASAAFFRFEGKYLKISGRRMDGTPYEEELEAREAPLAAIDHLWARARVVDLEDEFRASHAEKIKQAIIALSVKHTVLTRFTAFVAIDEAEAVKGGKPRTVVQPVEMPADWAPQQRTRSVGRMMTMGALPAGAGPMVPMAKAQAPGGASAGAPGFLGKLKEIFSQSDEAESEPPEAIDPSTMMMGAGCARFLDGQITGTSAPVIHLGDLPQALEAFLLAFSQAHAEVKAGRLPSAQPLKEARVRLMKALGLVLELATLLTLLQKFLRADAVDLIAALAAAGATAASLAPLFEERARALEQARDQARPVLVGAGQRPPAGSFWEASI
jgi:Ca-activated chloride channel family protein